MSVRNFEVLQSAEVIQVAVGLMGFPSLLCLIEPRMASGMASTE